MMDSKIFKDQYEVVSLETTADISVGSVKSAAEQYKKTFGHDPKWFITSPEDYKTAKEVIDILDMKFEGISTVPFLPHWSWMLAGDKGCIWSPGV